MGVVGMCKEHLGVALALKVPVFFVITKVDICPEHVLKNTVQVGTLSCLSLLLAQLCALALTECSCSYFS
jgi:GTPase